MDLPISLLLTLVFSTLPFWWVSRVQITRGGGAAIWLVSPVVVFYMAFLVAFVIKPWLSLIVFESQSEYLQWSEEELITAQLLGVLSCIAFFAGYLFRARWPTLTRPSLGHGGISTFERSRLLRYQICLFLFALACAYVYSEMLSSAGALTTDLKANRGTSLADQIGNGQQFLINFLQSIAINLGLAISIWTRKIGILGWTAILVFLAINGVVTNRSIVTLMLMGILFVYLLRVVRSGNIPSVKLMIGAISLVVVIGIIAGIVRNDEILISPQSLLVHLSATFDMCEMLAQTMGRVREFEWGQSWIEDIIYTYLPRAIWPSKPTIYGTTRLQLMTGINSLDAEDNFVATFPIGIFAESYANFGVFGVIFVLFLLGAFLGYLYRRICSAAFTSEMSWSTACLTTTYILICSNSLGYMRSFGGFMAGLLITAILSITLSWFVKVVVQLIWGAGSANKSLYNFQPAIPGSSSGKVAVSQT